MNKIVLITGAHGFIGRNVAKYCAQKGFRVIGIGYGLWEEPEWKKWGLHHWLEGTISLDSLRETMTEPDIIIHCAGSGSVGFSIDQPGEDFRCNVGNLLSVLEFIRLYSPNSKLVYPSSAAVYGITVKLPITENDTINPVSPYGFHKKIAEELCRSYGYNYGVAVAVVRLFSVYGPGLQKQLLWDACEKARADDPVFFGTGNESRDFIHVEDAAELLCLVAEKSSPVCPVFNGGAGTNLKIRDIIEKLYYCIDYKRKPCFSEQQRDGDPIHYLADISKANSLGWNPKIDINTGINEYANWYKGCYL